MTVATLSQVLTEAVANHYALAGLVELGCEDARAFVEATAEVGSPNILQAGPGCRRHTPVPVLGKMVRTLAGINGSSNAHSASVRSLGQRSLPRS